MSDDGEKTVIADGIRPGGNAHNQRPRAPSEDTYNPNRRINDEIERDDSKDKSSVHLNKYNIKNKKDYFRRIKERDNSDAETVKQLQEDMPKEKRDYFMEKTYRKLNNRWLVVMSSIAVFFVASLGSLQRWFPDYFNDGFAMQHGETNEPSATISGYISLAPGTAAMGSVFFFPIMFMWELSLPKETQHLETSKYVPKLTAFSLALFQLFFGLFLALPNVYSSKWHGAVVGGFAVAGLISLFCYFRILYDYCMIIV